MNSSADADPLDGILPYYRTGTHHIGEDFFKKCLSSCVAYDRAAGYFSSSVLVSWAAILPNILANEVRIRLLISPELSVADTDLLKTIASTADRADFLQKHADAIVNEALEFALAPADRKKRQLLLAWLIASNQLELRFAAPTENTDESIFHDKSGVFTYPDQRRIGFAGSANETGAAYKRNTERIFVFKSWDPAALGAVNDLEKDFQKMWTGDEGRLTVIPLSEAAMKKIKAMSPKDRPDFSEDPVLQTQGNNWAHQTEAVEAFCKARHGVLEMATGTGKTKTALLIAERLLLEKKIDGLIVAVNGTDLLDQWSKTLVTWAHLRRPPLTVLRQYETHYQAQTYALHPAGRILVISRQQLGRLFHLLPKKIRASLLIVHDEVHGLGAPSLRNEIPDETKQFGYRLGLSATPEREYDAEGSQFIENEIGQVVYRFTIEDAIKRGILSEFTYIPLEYSLTDDDRRRLKAVYAKQAARKLAGNPMSIEELWTEIARIYKTAEEKPAVFANYLVGHKDVLKRAIIFVEEKEYGGRILPIISPITHNYRTYYAEDDRAELIRFASNELDCLITCHRISQGIDIRNLRAVILFSSARARLETIQRIGRVLRVDPHDPNKRAVVIDFVRKKNEEDTQYPSADDERASWLTELSNTRREAQNGS